MYRRMRPAVVTLGLSLAFLTGCSSNQGTADAQPTSEPTGASNTHSSDAAPNTNGDTSASPQPHGNRADAETDCHLVDATDVLTEPTRRRGLSGEEIRCLVPDDAAVIEALRTRGLQLDSMQYEGSEGDDDVILRVHYRIKGEGCGYQLLMYDFPDDDFGKEGFLPFAAPDYWDGPTFATPGEAIDFRIEQGDWECV